MLLDYCVKSKVCNTCVFAARRFASAEPHVCPKNHLLVCSKSMKSDAGVEMVIKAWDKYPMFYTTTMAFNDDSTIGATANVLLRIYYYKIPKKWRKKGKPWMPSMTRHRPGFFSDSSQRGPKCDAKSTKADCLQQKIDYGCFIKNRIKTFEDFSAASMAPIHHIAI